MTSKDGQALLNKYLVTKVIHERDTENKSLLLTIVRFGSIPTQNPYSYIYGEVAIHYFIKLLLTCVSD